MKLFILAFCTLCAAAEINPIIKADAAIAQAQTDLENAIQTRKNLVSTICEPIIRDACKRASQGFPANQIAPITDDEIMKVAKTRKEFNKDYHVRDSANAMLVKFDGKHSRADIVTAIGEMSKPYLRDLLLKYGRLCIQLPCPINDHDFELMLSRMQQDDIKAAYPEGAKP